MIDEKLLSILVCPADHGPLMYVSDARLGEHQTPAVLYNPRLRRAYRIHDGIPVLLVDEAIDVSAAEHERLTTQANPADHP